MGKGISLKQAIIVIPIYKQAINDYENISLQQCFKVFNNFNICFVTYLGLDLTEYTDLHEKFGNNKLFIKTFQKSYFESTKSYSKLLLSKMFYQNFKQFDYMLIYQTDCFVFKNELNFWIEKGYDYIGAPWFEGFENNTNTNFAGVGNGGFSLRKVNSFIKVLNSFSYVKKPKTLFQIFIYNLKFLKLPKRLYNLVLNLSIKNNTFYLFNNYSNNEDLFWGIIVKNNFDWFKIPMEKEALKFCFEVNPAHLYKLNNNILPFGCHAWHKIDFHFWKQHIEKEGYIL